MRIFGAFPGFFFNFFFVTNRFSSGFACMERGCALIFVNLPNPILFVIVSIQHSIYFSSKIKLSEGI